MTHLNGGPPDFDGPTLCPVYVPVSDAPCFVRLPCAAHGVADAADAIEKHGVVYEQREGEVALHVYPRT